MVVLSPGTPQRPTEPDPWCRAQSLAATLNRMAAIPLFRSFGATLVEWMYDSHVVGMLTTSMPRAPTADSAQSTSMSGVFRNESKSSMVTWPPGSASGADLWSVSTSAV